MKAFQQAFELEVDGQMVSVDMKMMRRKSMRLSVTEQGVIDLRVPVDAGKADVLRFLQKHDDWLIERLRHHRQRQDRHLLEFQHLGQSLPLIRSDSIRRLEVLEDRVRVPSNWNDEQVLNALDKWRRVFAREEFSRQIDLWWPLFSQFAPAKPTLRVKKMRTRWGSLSTRGYINLNMALTQMPGELIELVVVHELCHLKHMDHGKGFQALMSQALPDWRAREKQLEEHARRLL